MCVCVCVCLWRVLRRDLDLGLHNFLHVFEYSVGRSSSCHGGGSKYFEGGSQSTLGVVLKYYEYFGRS